MTPSQFWTWFQDNQQKLYILPLLDIEERDKHFYWLSKHLSYYCKGLGFEIKFASDYIGPATLIITAYGVKDLYPKVFELIDHAPRIDNWKFEALKKASKDENSAHDTPYEFGSFKIKISDLYFQPVKYIKSTGKIIIHIYSDSSLRRARQRPGAQRSNPVKPINPKDIHTAITFILEDLMGEELLYSKIKKFKFYKINRKRGITYKLTHLKSFLEMINQN
ncbi:MAG: hypothetical protein CMP05_06000 [Xanthomarina sp.]|uniref:hypothetical protein n=1 Tax=Xanthomarina sp. TaxID=1931211 RepID=UPI000C65E803|nr:hypothetical protein [Xanthomarina sp.]MBF61535.1 hypothetical protein [Xanthomarina sp.]HAI18306.1 hypothetical protein [Xanthomarina gelatinilytica]|tara:strand:+ start:114 stop:776 length:663 start_codon:yes stop_codon:yes gene_type:complete